MSAVLPILVGERIATFPFPMSEEDFALLVATLDLWKEKLTRQEPVEDWQI